MSASLVFNSGSTCIVRCHFVSPERRLRISMVSNESRRAVCIFVRLHDGVGLKAIYLSNCGSEMRMFILLQQARCRGHSQLYCKLVK